MAVSITHLHKVARNEHDNFRESLGVSCSALRHGQNCAVYGSSALAIAWNTSASPSPQTLITIMTLITIISDAPFLVEKSAHFRGFCLLFRPVIDITVSEADDVGLTA
jgi:hypothetical protein